MRTKLLLVAALTIIGPLTANAMPVLYRATYTPVLGPSGTGSFLFDSDVGSMTNFVWDFGDGRIGGIPVGPDLISGDTTGRFIFEMLSETDVHSGLNCVTEHCSIGTPFTGAGLVGAVNFSLVSSAFWDGVGSPGVGAPGYFFSPTFSFVDAVALGTVRIARVPEPTTFALLGAALVTFGILRRRRKGLT